MLPFDGRNEIWTDATMDWSTDWPSRHPLKWKTVLSLPTTYEKFREKVVIYLLRFLVKRIDDAVDNNVKLKSEIAISRWIIFILFCKKMIERWKNLIKCKSFDLSMLSLNKTVNFTGDLSYAVHAMLPKKRVKW